MARSRYRSAAAACGGGVISRAGCAGVVVAAAGFGALAGAPAALGGETWDPTPTFGVVSGNPNGVWSYGWMDIGFTTFTLYTNSGTPNGNPQWWGWGGDLTPCIWKNMGTSISYGVEPGQIALHPGNGNEPSVLRWTAPSGAAGQVRVVGRFYNGDIGGPNVAVHHNGGVMWSAFNSGEFDLAANVHEGDTIDFAVYDAYGFGNTPLEVTISTGCAAACYANCDCSSLSPVLNVNDFTCFVNKFAAGDAYANCDGSTVAPTLNVNDFTCFLNAYAAGCAG